jgi:adenosylcobinamide-GDP ribazoletransferase
MMCAFPLVGAVIGMLVWGWRLLCVSFGFGTMLQAAGLTVIPIAVTGGIHLDGLCDVADALASNSDAARRREILKDPHTGAFAVIWCVCYVLLYFALSAELALRAAGLPVMCLSFVLSRALSGLSVLTIPSSSDAGLAASFKASAPARAASGVLITAVAVCGGLILLAGPAPGGAALAAAGACVLLLNYTARRKFGGMSGDLAGWFLQLCELAVLTVLVLSQHMRCFFD